MWFFTAILGAVKAAGVVSGKVMLMLTLAVCAGYVAWVAHDVKDDFVAMKASTQTTQQITDSLLTRIEVIEESQYTNAMDQYNRDVAQNSYLKGLSLTFEKSFKTNFSIQREYSKPRPNLELINYMEAGVLEDQKKNLPHNNMASDSALWQRKPLRTLKINHRLQGTERPK